MCISSERVFMEVLTRHAPVPQASIIMPSRPTIEALA